MPAAGGVAQSNKVYLPQEALLVSAVLALRQIKRLHQTPRCIWFTGLSGSGKSTIANLLEKRLHAQGLATYTLDGDNVRHGS